MFNLKKKLPPISKRTDTAKFYNYILNTIIFHSPEMIILDYNCEILCRLITRNISCKDCSLCA